MSKQVINDLPELLQAGVIDSATLDRIRDYYGQRQPTEPGGRINLLFAIIGTLLVSLGIILIVAHNWDDLSRTVKLFFSFMPLVVGQALCGFALYKKMDDLGFRESSAVFLFFAVGACLALVSQLYHISETVGDIIFMWMLTSFPLIYILRSSMVSLLYICGITIYVFYEGYNRSYGQTYHYWWMLLLLIPHYLSLLTKRPQSNFTYFHHWLVPLSLTISLGSLASHSGELLFVAYMSMFGAFYLLGTSHYFSKSKIFSNGYLVLGSLGTMCLLLAFSFRWIWEEVYQPRLSYNIFTSPEGLAAILLSLAATVLLIRQLSNKPHNGYNYMGFIFLMFIVLFAIGVYNVNLATILTNIIVLAAAIFTIDRGNRLNHLGILNYGLLVITALVVCRFFDTNLSFVFRGLLFIAVGAGFFIANKSLLNKRKKLYEQ